VRGPRGQRIGLRGLAVRAVPRRHRPLPVPFFGFGGGPLPGAGTLVATRTSPAFGAGLFVSDFLLWFGVTYENATEYDTRVYVAGSECDRWLSEEMARGATVLGLGGDSTRGDGTCTLLGVRAVDAGVAISYLSGLSLASSAVDFLNQHDDTRRYVVTALSEVDAGLYAFVAEARENLLIPEQYEARFELAGSDDVVAVASGLADAGMVITAATWGPSGYALVGTRPAGSTRRYAAEVLQRPGIDPGPDFGDLLAGQFAPVAFLLARLPDGGPETVVIGQK
jgi:hypothetical protein